MSVRIIRLGSARTPGEGLRIGAVRRPPRGVRKADFARKNWYDVWFPNLAPSSDLVAVGLTSASEEAWSRFCRAYRSEMRAPGPRHDLQLLAALSHTTSFSLGCYCEREDRCHRSVLRELLCEAGADLITACQ